MLKVFKLWTGLIALTLTVLVAFSVFYKPRSSKIDNYIHRPFMGDELSDLSLPIKKRANITTSTSGKPYRVTEPETPYHRIDKVPEETEKLPFLKNFKNPCWREAISGKSSRIRCLPFFYLVGAAKCGTSDLHRRLISHPQISSTVEKEIHWISKRRSEAKLSLYLRHFDIAVETDIIPSGHNGYHAAILGDFSPTTLWWNLNYLKSPSTKFTSNADVIHHLNPATKILVTLRNPVERAYSDFKHFNPGASPDRFHSTVVNTIKQFNYQCKRATHLKSCIDRYTDHLLIGIYYVRIEDFLRVFPRKQIFITKLEERSKNMNTALNEIFSFLEIEPLPDNITADIVSLDITAKNTSGRPYMLDTTKNLLEDFFKPFNERLGALIGQEYNYNLHK